jgi:hypothetical protein
MNEIWRREVHEKFWQEILTTGTTKRRLGNNIKIRIKIGGCELDFSAVI